MITTKTDWTTRRRSRPGVIPAALVFAIASGSSCTDGTVDHDSYQRDARVGTARTRCAELENEVERSMAIWCSQEVPADGMWDHLVEDEKLERRDLVDPWGEEYRLTTDDDGRYIVFSKGPDRRAETDDDLYRDGTASGN